MAVLQHGCRSAGHACRRWHNLQGGSDFIPRRGNHRSFGSDPEATETGAVRCANVSHRLALHGAQTLAGRWDTTAEGITGTPTRIRVATCGRHAVPAERRGELMPDALVRRELRLGKRNDGVLRHGRRSARGDGTSSAQQFKKSGFINECVSRPRTAREWKRSLSVRRARAGGLEYLGADAEAYEDPRSTRSNPQNDAGASSGRSADLHAVVLRR